MSETAAPETGAVQDVVHVQREGEQIGGPATVEGRTAPASPQEAKAQEAPQHAVPQFEPQVAPMTGTANQSPSMPPNATAAAGRAHAMLGHFINMAKAMQVEIEKYVPAQTVQMGERDVVAFLKSVL